MALVLFAGGLLATVAQEVASESVSLSTYYPAPSGVYTDLISTSNAYLARDSGFLDVGTNSPLAAGVKMAVLGGKVGIGTVAPAVMLDVRGSLLLENVGNAVGGRCAPEGSLSYDYAAHASIYCSQSGTWSASAQASGLLGGDCTTPGSPHYPATSCCPNQTGPFAASGGSGGTYVYICSCAAGWTLVRHTDPNPGSVTYTSSVLCLKN